MHPASVPALAEALPVDVTSQVLASAHARDAEAAAALMLGVSWLQGCERLHEVPKWLVERTRDALRQLPTQHDPRLNAHPAAGWMLLVSLADSMAAFEIARVLLDEIERLLDALVHESPPVDITEATPFATANFRALVCARRGRLSRQRGDVGSAVEWYRSGLRRLRGLPKGDGWATCTLGLAVCAQSAGNFPETMRRCRTVLRAGTSVAKHNRFGAHLTLAVGHRRLNELERALHHAWFAFDLARSDDSNRFQCLINLAEISLRLGQPLAARNGFLLILSVEQPERNRIPARVGLLEAETLIWQTSPNPDTEALRAKIEGLLADAHECRQPYERIKALLGAMDAAVAISWIEQAKRIDTALISELSAAVKLGTTFREFEFRRETILARLSAASATPQRPTAELNRLRARVSIGARAERVVAQITALTATDVVS